MLKHRTLSEKTGDIANVVVLVLLMLTMLFPFVYIFAVSFSTNDELFRNPLLLWPKVWTVESYQYILESVAFPRAMLVTAYVAIVATFFNLLFTSMMGFATTRPIIGKKVIMFLVLFTMLFSGGLIPTYLLMKSLGLLNSLWALIIPGFVGAWTLIVYRTFVSSIPEELIDAAFMDGANELNIYSRIILPMSKPVLAAFALFGMVSYWNTWFSAIIYINDPAKWTIQVVLRQIVIVNDALSALSTDNAYDGPPPLPETIQMAAIMLATLPILLVYPFLQKYFVKGVMIGSIKG
ncbi:carbohydrate ABC transporter permease [Paenibacillus cymbidii]|uniref:carbohydrate ABC transporter permease n=1 Tax=Paenibacillus cymbidii TaxID=1639034 RepID=UPI001080951D|nr:carbohydrate ABC transporter permease [Paenibacillus cymbidii]